jgi:tetratricopeptide (TPR) repeat protein
LECPRTLATGFYDGFQLVHYRDGSSYSEKHTRDVKILNEWVRRIGDPVLLPRALFHLAQAYHALKLNDEALETYRKHLEVETFTNYRFQSRYHIALILLSINTHYDDVRRAFLESIFEEQDGILRWEPYYHLARLARQTGRVNECLFYSNAALKAPPLDHSRMPLFIDAAVFHWKLELERAHCMLQYGFKKEAKELYVQIVRRPLMKNAEMRDWILSEIRKIKS